MSCCSSSAFPLYSALYLALLWFSTFLSTSKTTGASACEKYDVTRDQSEGLELRRQRYGQNLTEYEEMKAAGLVF